MNGRRQDHESEEPRLVGPRALSELLCCHVRTVRRLTAASVIPVVYVGSKLPRYSVAQVLEALRDRGRR